jgi:hypothetical protein
MYAENSFTTMKDANFYSPLRPANCHKELFRLFIELRSCPLPNHLNMENTQQGVSYSKCRDLNKSIHNTRKLKTCLVFSMKKFPQNSIVYKANIYDVDLENRKVT